MRFNSRFSGNNAPAWQQSSITTRLLKLERRNKGLSSRSKEMAFVPSGWLSEVAR
ncbi:MAG UNVERIFIED_CONTAM: hypothetical protein LVR29_00405 [Microcystis novacekii LVE1205-3]